MKELTCDHCNKVFEVSSEQWKGARSRKKIRGQNHYCSFECRLDAKGHKKKELCKCTTCNKEFERSYSEKIKSENNFCSQTCAATLNNSLRPKRQRNKICKSCDNLCMAHKSFCEPCIVEGKHLKNGMNLGDRTFADEMKDREHLKANKYSNIRGHARKITASREQACEHCGYDKHVETCHIKAIKDFAPEVFVRDINDPKNLILLCPNCHWEFDHPKEVGPVGFEPTTVQDGFDRLFTTLSPEE